jgi:hypothetical protein
MAGRPRDAASAPRPGGRWSQPTSTSHRPTGTGGPRPSAPTAARRGARHGQPTSTSTCPTGTAGPHRRCEQERKKSKSSKGKIRERKVATHLASSASTTALLAPSAICIVQRASCMVQSSLQLLVAVWRAVHLNKREQHGQQSRSDEGREKWPLTSLPAPAPLPSSLPAPSASSREPPAGCKAACNSSWPFGELST